MSDPRSDQRVEPVTAGPVVLPPGTPPTAGRSRYDLSRRDMERIIAEGRSVLHNGTVISNVNDLPQEHELAAGDATREAAEIERLKAQLEQTQAQLSAAQSGADRSAELDDTRGSEAVPYDQLDRNALKAVARDRGIDFTSSASKQELVEKLQADEERRQQGEPQGEPTATGAPA